MDPSIFISVLFAVGIGLMFIGIDLVITGRQRDVEKRIDVYRNPAESRAGDNAVSDAAKSGRARHTMAAELARAGLPVTVGEFYLATLMVVLLLAVLAYALFRQPVALLIGGAAGFFIPRFYLRHLQGRRLDAFNAQLESAIILVSNSLRSGYGLAQALDAVAKESSPPLSVEFGRVTREMGLGISMRDALANLLARNPSGDLDLIITAINVNHEVGGNLTEVLDRIAGTIRERVRLAGEVKTITSMQRFSGQILVGLPFVLTGLIYLMNSEYISLLWSKSCGLIMLAVWAILTILGILSIRKLLAFRF